MSEMSFEQMLEESFKTIRNGEVVEGTVIDVKPDEIVLKYRIQIRTESSLAMSIQTSLTQILQLWFLLVIQWKQKY